MATTEVKRTKKQQAAHEKQIETLAMALRKFLEERSLWAGCVMYYNGNKVRTKSDGTDELEDGADPRNSTEYGNADTICLVFEESELYGELNYGSHNPETGKLNWKTVDDLQRFFESTPYYYELGHSWNLSLYEN